MIATTVVKSQPMEGRSGDGCAKSQQAAMGFGEAAIMDDRTNN
jgi:hypothetical protein